MERIPSPHLPSGYGNKVQFFIAYRCFIHVRRASINFLPCILSIIKKEGKKKRKIAELARNPVSCCGVKFAPWKNVSKATILNQVTPETREWWVHHTCCVGSHFVNLKWFPLSSKLGERLILKVSIITVLLYYLSHHFFSLKLSEVHRRYVYSHFVLLQCLVVVSHFKSRV